MRGGGATTAAQHQKAERLRRLLRQRDLISVEAARLAGELNADGFAQASGCETMIDWIRHECHQSWSQARDLVAVGDQIDNLCNSLAVLEERAIGFGHVALIAQTCDKVGGGLSAEDRLVEVARGVSVSRFRYFCEQARHAEDPRGAAREQRDQHEQRQLVINTREDGMVTLGGIFDPAGGALVKAALQPLSRRLGREDDRSHEQRPADGLVELVSSRTHTYVHISATLGTLLQVEPAAPADLWGHLVPKETLRRLSCGGSVDRLLFNSESVLIDAGRERRVVSPRQRRVLEQRDRHCRWPGCSKRASWCEAHHVVHWASGGATDMDNLVLLCWFHHRLVHEGSWQLLLQADGSLQPVRPPLDFAAPVRGPDPDHRRW